MRIAIGPPGPGIVRAVTLATGSGAAASGSGRPRASVGLMVGSGGSPASSSTTARALGWSLSCATATVLPPDPLGRGVDVEPVVPQEADKCHPEAFRGRDGEARGSADRGEDRDARRDRLLHDLISSAAAHRQHRPLERQPAIEQGAPNDLVDRVMPADVLAKEL